MSMMAGPSAFPSQQLETLDGSWNQTFDPGMTIRDYFAGQALVALGTWCPPDCGYLLDGDLALRARSEWAYRHADAMLAVRAKGGEA